MADPETTIRDPSLSTSLGLGPPQPALAGAALAMVLLLPPPARIGGCRTCDAPPCPLPSWSVAVWARFLARLPSSSPSSCSSSSSSSLSSFPVPRFRLGGVSDVVSHVFLFPQSVLALWGLSAPFCHRVRLFAVRGPRWLGREGILACCALLSAVCWGAKCLAALPWACSSKITVVLGAACRTCTVGRL